VTRCAPCGGLAPTAGSETDDAGWESKIEPPSCEPGSSVKEEQGDYATDETPNMLSGSIQQLLGFTRSVRRALLPTTYWLDENEKCLTWAERIQLEGISWADMSRAVTKIDKLDQDRAGSKGDEEEVTAPQLAEALGGGANNKRKVTVAVARVLLQKYRNEAKKGN